MKRTAKILLIAAALITASNIFYHAGYNTAIKEAEPYIENERFLIQFGDKVHDYGDPTEITVQGSVTSTFDDNGETLYQFKSDDNSTWWVLSVEDFDSVPEISDKVVLTYDNNGTTFCPHEDCECYVYDDTIVEVHNLSR